MSSKVVISDTSTWLVTLTEYGFLAWVDTSLDKPLGYFDSFDLAKQEILDTINPSFIDTKPHQS